MPMRVITGSAKGKRLLTPVGTDVRPTPERVKEGLFSALQFDIEGRRVLDLFSGTGQLAIEAVSRGAVSAVSVDSSAASIRVIKSNVEACGFSEQIRVVQSDYASFCAMCRDEFDIVFLDPPYGAGLFMPALKSVLPLMSDYGTVILEHPPEVKPEPEVGGFCIKKSYRYGKVLLTVYGKGDGK